MFYRAKMLACRGRYLKLSFKGKGITWLMRSLSGAWGVSTTIRTVRQSTFQT